MQASAQGPRPAGIKAALTDRILEPVVGWTVRPLRGAGVGREKGEALTARLISQGKPLPEGEAERRLLQGGGRMQEWKPERTPGLSVWPPPPSSRTSREQGWGQPGAPLSRRPPPCGRAVPS